MRLGEIIWRADMLVGQKEYTYLGACYVAWSDLINTVAPAR